MACRVGALQSTEFPKTGASGRAQLTADHAAIIRTEANAQTKGLLLLVILVVGISCR